MWNEIYSITKIKFLGGFERVSDASHRELIPPASLGGI